jgi:hypothetical protein
MASLASGGQVADAVWTLSRCGPCVKSGIEDSYRNALPSSLLPTQDYVFPASCAASKGTATLALRSSGDATNAVWFAPAGGELPGRGAGRVRRAAAGEWQLGTSVWRPWSNDGKDR